MVDRGGPERAEPLVVELDRTNGWHVPWISHWPGPGERYSERGFQFLSMNSFNDYALGSAGEWMYRFLLGINQEPGTADWFTSRVEFPPAITGGVRVRPAIPLRVGEAAGNPPASPVGFPVAQDAEEAAFRVASGVRGFSGPALPGAEPSDGKKRPACPDCTASRGLS